MTPIRLAWANLWHHRGRTLPAVVGVAFVVLLLFMQLGFYGAIRRTATMLIDHIEFDLMLVSSESDDLSRTIAFSRTRLEQAAAVDGVERVAALSTGAGAWRNPEQPTAWWKPFSPVAGSSSSINILGVAPADLPDVFVTEGSDAIFAGRAAAKVAAEKVTPLGTALIDTTSQPEFGSFVLFEYLPNGKIGARFNSTRVDVVGEFTLGTGFSWKGMLIASEETFQQLTFQGTNEVTLGLIRVTEGADVEAVRDKLKGELPKDVQVRTRAEAARIETEFWVDTNAIGQLLFAGVILAIVIGFIFLSQMMAADIGNRLPEYATAKALGYRPGYLTSVVLWQAVCLAVVGYIPGILIAFGGYSAARTMGGLPMVMEFENGVIVLVAAIGICCISAGVAVRKVHQTDPATLF